MGGVVLMNLLIAMMADTFAAVTAAATAEWNLVFAGMVREGGLCATRSPGRAFSTTTQPPHGLLKISASLRSEVGRGGAAGPRVLRRHAAPAAAQRVRARRQLVRPRPLRRRLVYLVRSIAHEICCTAPK